MKMFGYSGNPNKEQAEEKTENEIKEITKI